MKALFTLTPAESRRLIAKAVAAMEEVRRAWKDAYVLLASGTTNAFVAQELLGDPNIRPELCGVGVSSNGVLCISDPESRRSYANVFYKGEARPDKSYADAFNDFHPETVVIKGANAVDPEGRVGVITAGFDGGTVPRLLGTVTSKGLMWITPVGLEKLVPSVSKAAAALGGANSIDVSLGADCGMFVLTNTTVVTEIEAIRILFGAEAALVCAGGIGGNQGAVTLVAEGEAERIKALVGFLESSVKGEPPVPGNKGVCETCNYRFCRYQGRKTEALPQWMR